jgi:hypothetical protein
MLPVSVIAAAALSFPIMARPIEGAEKVFALYTVANTLVGDGGSRLVLGVWADGYVVWSEDRVRGGPPYRAGRADPKKVAAFFAKVEVDHPFDDKMLGKQSHIIPDADYATLFVKSGKETLFLCSVHELFEENPKVVVKGAGVEPIGAGRYAALKKAPRGFLFFRLVWGEIRSGAAGLTPADSKPVRGRIVNDEKGAVWVEFAR